MQTLIITINNSSALKTLRDLERRDLISIVDHDDTDSPALPGKTLNLSQFKKWITDAERAPTVSLEEAKSIWAGKRKQIKRISNIVNLFSQ